MEVIRSPKNLELKKMLLLYKKSRERKKQGLFIIEGEREIINGLKSKYILERIFLEEGVVFKNVNIKNAISNTPTSVVEKKSNVMCFKYFKKPFIFFFLFDWVLQFKTA